MLSEDAIENLVQPIVDRQESINTMTLETIAKRIDDIGTIKPADINRMKILIQMGGDIRKINEELARISKLQVSDIKGIIKTVAIDSYIDAKPLYDYRHKSFIPFAKNEPLQKIVTAIGNVTAKEYVNISNSKATGFLIGKVGDREHLVFKPIDKTYQQIIDEAIQASKSGVVDYRTAMRRALKRLSDSGIRRISWDSGYTQRLDTVVRRNIMGGIHDIQQSIEDEISKQINADAKELSVHQNSALDHEPLQGHIFLNEEYEKLQNNEPCKDINGKSFDALDRVIGEWNCRHFAYGFIVGVSKPHYTQNQLDEIIKQNHKGFVLPNGKHLTMYECTQMQRQMETKIRYAKEEQMMWTAGNDKEKALKARQRVEYLTREYKIFSKNCGLSISKDRMTVLDYKVKV